MRVDCEFCGRMGALNYVTKHVAYPYDYNWCSVV